MLGILVVGAGGGAAVDLASRRIPNVLVLGTAAAGIGLAAAELTDVSWPAAVAGLTVGLLLMLPGHIWGATGAGDVKLFGAVGAVVGIDHIIAAFCWTALAGGLMATGYAVQRGQGVASWKRATGLVTSPRQTRAAIRSPGMNNRFPYGPAIAAGAVLSVVVGG